MDRLERLENAVRFLIRMNAALSYRLAVVETGDGDDARQWATVSALCALATMEGFTADTLPDERFEEILHQVDAELDSASTGVQAHHLR